MSNSTQRANRVAGIVLAAGQSKRMQGANKLLLEVDGITMIRKVVGEVVASGLDPIWVVTGFERQRIEACLEGLPARFVFNDRFHEGMGSSIAKGILNLDTSDIDGILVCLGDLPQLTSETIKRILEAYEQLNGDRIVVPSYEGRRGHPVIFPVRFREELERLSGDVGARDLMRRERECVFQLEVEDEGVALDIDSR